MKTSIKQMIYVLILCMVCILSLTAAVNAGSYQNVENRYEYGLGHYDNNTQTFFGDYKGCATDVFVYFILVNDSGKDVTVTLPRHVVFGQKINEVNPDTMKYKVLPSTWNGANFADAKGGVPLIPNQLMQVTLPAKEAWSVMLEVNHVSHFLLNTIGAESDGETYVQIKAVIFFDNKKIEAKGLMREEGDLCHAIYTLPFMGRDYVEGRYGISEKDSKTCSIAYYMRVVNQDLKYSTTIELPRWVEINDYKYFVGCEFIDETCGVSGFRHYAYAKERSDGKIVDSDFIFCDKDLSNGDHCYVDGSDDLWWLEVAPQESVVIRGMVNDLCSNIHGFPNPLTEERILMGMYMNDSCSNRRWVEGEIIGTPKNLASKEITELNRDPNTQGNVIIETWTEYVDEETAAKYISDGIDSDPVVYPYTLVEKSEFSAKAPSTVNPQKSQPAFIPFDYPDFWLDEPSHEYHFPGTGFPANAPRALREQPKELRYTELNGLELQIPSLNLNSKIVEIPESEGTWAVDWLGENAGLLEGSFLPGEGVTVLAGHNHLNTTEAGPFALISTLESGDRIFIRNENEEMLTYSVYENALMDANDFDAAASTLRENALVLITCEDETLEGTYANRRVVYAEPL